jgi:hypothetical protein
VRKKGSGTPVELIIRLFLNPNAKTKDLVAKGYNAFTIRRYRKKVEAERSTI